MFFEYFFNKLPSIVFTVVLPELPVTAINLAEEQSRIFLEKLLDMESNAALPHLFFEKFHNK